MAMLLNRFLDPGLAAGLRDEARKLRPARDLAVNAVLPFLNAWEQAQPGDVVRGPAEILYGKYPLLAGNEVT